MKNKAGFYTTSAACAARGGEDMATGCILKRKIEAAGFTPYDSGCEWHHASGNRIAFFAETPEEIENFREFERRVDSAWQELENLPKSKAAVWRGLVDSDCGFGGVDYKIGKFGRFVCSYGEPDGRGFYPSAEFARVAKRLLF